MGGRKCQHSPFFEPPSFVVKERPATGDERFPTVDIKADDKILCAVRLAQAGYGSPEEILNMRVDVVIHMILYDKFYNEYQRAYQYLNLKKRD